MINSPIEEIKNKLDVVEVILSYIKLQKAGVNYRGVCPFHPEKKPSLFVSPVRQIWHCFGCGAGTNIFDFVMKIEGLEFGDALRILAQRAGVELKRQDPQTVKWRTERQRLFEICELSSQFFEKQLELGNIGKSVKKYLLERGITEESIKKWRIGWSPDTWQGLSDFLVGKGFKRDEVVRAGLTFKNEKGNYSDRFRSRIIFPVFDLNSQIIGFGGRVFNNTKEVAKYINTPATLLYDKSQVLYGLDKAKVEIRRKGYCILVEGYIDVIMVFQSGFENVAATSGTALTQNQLKVLKRYSENLLTAFDMDVAGNSATKRGIDLALDHGFNVKVITMPESQDPADIVLKDQSSWEGLVEGAKSILEFYFEVTFSKFDSGTAEGKKEISKVLLPVIKRIPNKIEQSYWIQQLSGKLGIKEEIIEQELKKASLAGSEDFQTFSKDLPAEADEKGQKTRRELIEERITSLILRYPQNLGLIPEKCICLFSPQTKTILTSLRADPKSDISQNSEFLAYLTLKAEVELDEESINQEEEIQTCVREMQIIETKSKLDEISQFIKTAEEQKDFQKVDNLVQDFNKLAKDLTSSS